MKRTTTLLLTLTLLGGAPPILAAEGAGEEPRAPLTAAEKKQDKADKLVATAKAAKAKRKSSSSRVITNADVKKSKGKLIVIDSKKPAPDAVKPKTPSLVQQDEQYKARIESSDRVNEFAKRVTELEKELERAEQRYYEENDPNFRDSVLQKRFAQTKRQLEDARQTLADERDALQKIVTPQP